MDQVRSNRGSAGIDRKSIKSIEIEGVDKLLEEIQKELVEQTYQPLPARRVYIPKPGSSKKRALSIPSIKDRIVQTAAKIVIEPLFEASF